MYKDDLKEAIFEAFEYLKVRNELKEIIKYELFKAINEDKWITIHPHGDDSEDYRRLLIKEGETVEDAMHRQGYYSKRKAKDEKTLKDELKQLYQDILKAKKDGNKELHHKLLEKYKQVEEQLKGKKEPEEKKKEETQSKKLAGVAKGEPMSRAQADNNNPNPDYMEKPGCTTNCQTCVVAFEARLRGYDVKALGNHNNPTIKSLSHRTNEAWIDPKTGKHPEYKSDVSVKNARSCYQWLEKELQTGNRYTLEFGWKGRRHSGHIVSIEKDNNNNIILYDPQNGHITTEKNDVLRYFQRFKYQMSTYGLKFPDPPKVLRVDNMDFNYEVVDKILDKSN